LDSASKLADRISEVTPQPTTVCIAPASDNASLIQRNEDLLSRQVASLSAYRARRRSRSRGKRPNDTTHPGEDPTAPTHCWYHRRFRDKAQKRTQPCSFGQQGNRNNSRYGRQTSAPQLLAASSSPTVSASSDS
jgi:hypothetical protein